MFFSWFKKEPCSNCQRKIRTSKMVKITDKWICSEECMVELFGDLSLQEIAELIVTDELMHGPYYRR